MATSLLRPGVKVLGAQPDRSVCVHIMETVGFYHLFVCLRPKTTTVGEHREQARDFNGVD